MDDKEYDFGDCGDYEDDTDNDVITRMTKIMVVMIVANMRTTKKDNGCDMRITKERLTGYK